MNLQEYYRACRDIVFFFFLIFVIFAKILKTLLWYYKAYFSSIRCIFEGFGKFQSLFFFKLPPPQKKKKKLIILLHFSQKLKVFAIFSSNI